jgi:predicted CXXCH cytochrome family protein
MPDPDVMMYVVQGGRKLDFNRIPRRKQRVVLTTGSHHYQTYWVTSPRYERLMQTLPLVYLLEDQRWAPREEAFLRGPKDEGRFITQWNHHCIRCHSTGGNPGLNLETGMLETRVGEFGIACEACHGPGEAHVNWQRKLSEMAPEQVAEAVDPIVNPRKLDHRRSSQVCGQCHGVYVMRDEFAMQSAFDGALFKPGEDLHATRYYIQYPTPDGPAERLEDLRRNPRFFQERWWDDGKILAGGREYTALSITGCYQRGEISCLSCHTMHGSDPNDQLKRFPSENAQCTQCHREDQYTGNLAKHTFHRAESSGSDCLNCHMPHTTYALFKGIRSHQIVSPSLEGTLVGGAPNACNLCHLDQTLAWTQQHLVDWYGAKPVELTEEQRTVSAGLTWLLQGHAAYRAIAAWHFGWAPAQEASGKTWMAAHVARLLDDPYGVVRYVAARSLRTLPGFEDFEYDFLAAESVLAERSQAAIRQWKAGRGESSVHGRNLIDAEGEVMEAAVADLLRRRDHRSVTIKE